MRSIDPDRYSDELRRAVHAVVGLTNKAGTIPRKADRAATTRTHEPSGRCWHAAAGRVAFAQRPAPSAQRSGAIGVRPRAYATVR